MAFLRRDIKNFVELSNAPRLRDVIKWRIKENPFKIYKRVEDKTPCVDVDITALKVERNFILWIGHSSMLIDIDGRRILIDPVLKDRILSVKRSTRLGYTVKDLLPVDYVLISHNHIDHLESSSVKEIKDSARYLVPAGLEYFMKRLRVRNFITLNWFESYSEGGIEFTFVPAQHWSQRGIFDRNRSLWGGFIIRSTKTTLYYAGDTGYFDLFSKLKRLYGNFDISILPIGAYSPRWFSYKNHMSPYDAYRAFIELSSNKLLPVHWGTFRLGAESLSEPIRRLFALWEKEKIEEERLLFLPIGGIHSFSTVSKTARTSCSIT